MRVRHWATVAGLLVLVVLTSACTIEIARDGDGSLSVESTMGGAALESELNAAMADELIQDLTVDLHAGYIAVTAKRHRPESSEIDDLSFRLSLGAVGGQLTATISDAEVNGHAVDSTRVARWNGRIAKRLTRAAQRRPNSTLESVALTDAGLTMRWTVETPRSRNP